MSVSYTHLDVYKRQVLYDTPQPEAASKGDAEADLKTILIMGLDIWYTSKIEMKGVLDMDDFPCIAHIADDGRAQTVLAHLQGTAAWAREFARCFGGEGQAELAGLAHDIGKYSTAFQKRLRGEPVQVDHSTAGSVECWKNRQLCAAFAVAGHHTGLPDGGCQTDHADQPTLMGRIKRGERRCV